MQHICAQSPHHMPEEMKIQMGSDTISCSTVADTMSATQLDGRIVHDAHFILDLLHLVRIVSMTCSSYSCIDVGELPDSVVSLKTSMKISSVLVYFLDSWSLAAASPYDCAAP